MRFHARIQLHGKTATGIEVPPEVVARLGSGKRVAVRVTIHEYTYRSTAAYNAPFPERHHMLGIADRGGIVPTGIAHNRPGYPLVAGRRM